MDQHELVSMVKALASELRRTPTSSEFKGKFGSLRAIETFGGYTVLVQMAGLDPVRGKLKNNSAKHLPDPEKQDRIYRAICSKMEPLHGFFRHVIDLGDLFLRAGNPASIKVLIQPDTHAKYVDVPAWNCFVKFARYYDPHVHGLLGDFVDCEGLSHWPSSDMEPRRIVPEMKIGRAMLAEIASATPNAVGRFYCEGNHEDWINQAFARMPEMFEDLSELGIEINLKTLLALDKFGYTLYPLNHLVQIGKAHFTHGMFTGQSHARAHLNRFKANIYYGHIHDGQEVNDSSVDGPLEASSLFCLCRLDAKFLKGRPNNWGHGFGTFEFFPDGTYSFSKHRIINGKLSFNGTVFDGNP